MALVTSTLAVVKDLCPSRVRYGGAGEFMKALAQELRTCGAQVMTEASPTGLGNRAMPLNVLTASRSRSVRGQCALAIRVLDTVRDQRIRKARARAVPPGIRRAIQYLENDFASNLSLPQLADRARMSRSHFALTFRQFTGYAPHQYLLLVRLNQARKLLRQGNSGLSLAQIALACGFCDQAHLNQTFRRCFGTTPAAFRFQQAHS